MGCGSSKQAVDGNHKIALEAMSVDTNNDGLIQREELANFIATNEKLYLMLSVNLQLEVSRCQEVATEVAYQMSKRPHPNVSLRQLSPETKAREPTISEFQDFLLWLEEPKGQQEFFHRTVFSVFDVDGSGYIEPHELDNFLDIFYQAGSIFAGDARLPKRSKLKKEVMKQLDTNQDGKLEFSELRTLISGGARAHLTFSSDDDIDDDEDDDDESDESQKENENDAEKVFENTEDNKAGLKKVEENEDQREPGEVKATATTNPQATQSTQNERKKSRSSSGNERGSSSHRRKGARRDPSSSSSSNRRSSRPKNSSEKEGETKSSHQSRSKSSSRSKSRSTSSSNRKSEERSDPSRIRGNEKSESSQHRHKSSERSGNSRRSRPPSSSNKTRSSGDRASNDRRRTRSEKPPDH